MDLNPENRSAKDDFIECLSSSERILIILGAGLSRPSGMPTFRQDPYFWRLSVDKIATNAAFDRDPICVWSVYERLRQLARVAQPNLGHVAIAALAAAKPHSLTISQNIDDLSRKAGHDTRNLVVLHGSLFDVTCSNEACNYTNFNADEKPTVPGLTVHPWDVSDPKYSLPHLQRENIPPCPRCKAGTLRPGVVWFGEKLPIDALNRIDQWFETAAKVDLVLVIGTERMPFVYEAVEKGAQVAYFNIDCGESPADIEGADWTITGDVSQTLPHIVGLALGSQFEDGGSLDQGS